MADIAKGSSHTVHVVAESTYGTAPTTPTWTPIPITGSDPQHSRDAIRAGKLRSDRQISDLRLGNNKISPVLKGELEYGSFDALLEAGLMGTWTSNVLKAGQTRRSFTVERYFNLSTDEYHRILGAEVNTLDISIKPNAMVSITVGMIGQSVTLATTQIADSTYSAALTSKPFDSFTGTLNLDGSPIATVTQLDIKLDNGLEPAFVIGSQNTIRPADKNSHVSGTMSVYYTSKALYEKFINETEAAIEIALTDLDGNSLTIEIPRVKMTGGAPAVEGEGPVSVSIPFEALYSSGDATNILITRAPD